MGFEGNDDGEQWIRKAMRDGERWIRCSFIDGQTVGLGTKMPNGFQRRKRSILLSPNKEEGVYC